MVTVALDLHPPHAHPWIDAAAPEHPSLVDTRHVTGELFGFVNIPMAVWIDEQGVIVRNAESASIERSPLRDMDVPDELPDRMRTLLTEVKAIPDHAEAYRAAVVDWVEHGTGSRFSLAPDEVVARSLPRDDASARASACFELGRHLRASVAGGAGEAAAIRWWREAHRLDPGNWTYKRQAWTLATTPPGATENDLVQEAGEVYGTSWLDDVIASGGGANYLVDPRL